jgi:hypothetical protein
MSRVVLAATTRGHLPSQRHVHTPFRLSLELTSTPCDRTTLMAHNLTHNPLNTFPQTLLSI